MQYRRDQLLEATASAANVLLTLEDLSEAINTALNIIGAGAGCDLIAVLENRFESASPLPTYCNFIYEWASPGLPLPTANLSSKSFPSEFFGLAFLEQYFLEGSGFGGLLEDWHEPLRSWLASVQVQSAYTVPIRVNGQWWGVLCFDYYRAPIQIDSAEVAVLRTIADCIGSAIQRERLRHAELRTQQEREQIALQRAKDLEAYNQVLQGRDRLFEATAKATNVLLNQENFDEAINTALQIILESAGCDRIEVLENNFDGISPMPKSSSVIYEWASLGITRQMSAGIASKRTNHEGMEAFLEQHFLHGDGFAGLLDDWVEPLRSTMAAFQVKSSCSVPIRVNGHWWGCLSLNYCREATWISPAEGAVLRTIADCIGSAIQRERLHHAALRLQQERQQVAQQRTADLEAYNQVLQGRDRLFEATAKAANVLLTLENFDVAVNTALQCIGEGIGCDYVVVLENKFQSPLPLPSSCDFLYEWATPGFLPLSVTFGSTSLPAELLGVDFMKQYFLEGKGFGGLTEVWNEPLRSALVSVQVQSTYAVPIRVNGQWWGVLSLDYCQVPIQVSAAEISVLMAIADCIGSAIQRDRIHKHIRQAEQARTAELTKANHALRQTVDLLATEPGLDRLLGHMLKALAEHFDAPLIQYWENPEPGDIAYLRLSCHKGQLLTVAELPHDCLVTGIKIPPELIGYENIHTRKRYYVVEDVPTDPIQQAVFSPLNFDLETWCTAHGIRKMINIPLMQGEKTTGSLLLYFVSGHDLSKSQIELMYALSQQVTLGIQLTQLTEIKQTEAIARAQEQAAQERVDELVKANTALQQSLDILAADPELDRFIGNTLTVIAQKFDAPLIEYWVHSQAGGEASIHLAYWQGQILSAANGSIANADPMGMISFLDIPLSVGDTNIGALSIYLSVHRTFSGQTIELAHALAQQLTLAVELTRLAEEAQQLAVFQERTRMAREIHDTLAQAFGGILMQLQAFTYVAQTQPDQAQTHLLTAQALAQEGLAEARRSVWTLYLETTEYENLDQAIAKFIQQTQPRQATPIHLEIEGTPYSLHPDLGLNLLRIAQEAITNALRHAHATTIQVHLSYSAHVLQLTICDDGCGFDPESPIHGFGLLGMQQRASRIGASWNLMSRPGEGTTLMATLTNSQNTAISKA